MGFIDFGGKDYLLCGVGGGNTVYFRGMNVKVCFVWFVRLTGLRFKI